MSLIADNISVLRGATPVLTNVSATFDVGKFTVILGPNGAGKSTLLNVLAGLLPPSLGSVQLGGSILATLAAKQRARQIGLLPQSAETHWSVTGAALVALGRYSHQRGWGLSPADRAAIESAMTLTDTLQFAERPVNKLSGGERARVLMARVLAGEPSYILADEPLTNLDPGHQIDMLQLLRAQADVGKGVVAVLHDLSSAMRFADHLVLLHEGRIFTEGHPQHVLSADNLREVYGVKAEIAADNVIISGRV